MKKLIQQLEDSLDANRIILASIERRSEKSFKEFLKKNNRSLHDWTYEAVFDIKERYKNSKTKFERFSVILAIIVASPAWFITTFILSLAYFFPIIDRVALRLKYKRKERKIKKILTKLQNIEYNQKNKKIPIDRDYINTFNEKPLVKIKSKSKSKKR